MDIRYDRMYGFKELAVMYFPCVDTESASKQLRRWIKKGQLMAKRVDAGYRPRTKLLTPRQVAVIVALLGEPYMPHACTILGSILGLILGSILGSPRCGSCGCGAA